MTTATTVGIIIESNNKEDLEMVEESEENELVNLLVSKQVDKKWEDTKHVHSALKIVKEVLHEWIDY